MSSNNKTIVVTGASGFLGQALTSYLMEKGYVVHPVARSDMAGQVAFSDVPDGDVLIHLAEGSSPHLLADLGEVALERAFDNASYLASLPHPQKLYASSALVYGNAQSEILDEATNIEPLSLYGKMKQAGEDIFSHKNGTILRFATLYNERPKPNTLLADILTQLNKPNDDLLLRDKSALVDLLYIGDAVCAIEKIIENEATGVFNVGSGEGIVAEDLARKMLAIAGQHDRKILSEATAIRSFNPVMNIEKIYFNTGWKPESVLFDVLTKMVALCQGGIDEQKDCSGIHRE